MPFTLPASTGAASFTDASTTEAQQKTNLTNLRGFVAEMLGTDSTSRDTARSLLGIDHPSLTFSVASSALTIALKTPAGADATAAAPLTLAFRSATLSSGSVAVRKLTAAASLVVSSGSTLGTTSGTDCWLYVYALDNAGSIELAVSGTYYGDHFIGSTTAEGGAGAADSGSVIYSTSLRSSVAMRLLAILRSNQTTAGTWAAVPVESCLAELGGIERVGRLVLHGMQASTSGTAIDFTAIPTWVRRITVQFSGISVSGTDSILVQLGDAGGFETTGYLGAAGIISNAGSSATANFTTGFGLLSAAAGNVIHGQMVLTLMDASTNLWAASHSVGWSNGAFPGYGGGSKSLSATLDRVRVTTNGANTFDAGNINVLYE